MENHPRAELFVEAYRDAEAQVANRALHVEEDPLEDIAWEDMPTLESGKSPPLFWLAAYFSPATERFFCISSPCFCRQRR